MERVTVYLKTALFSLVGADGHLPAGSTILEGIVEDRPAGGLLLRVSRLHDHQGRDLGEAEALIFLPWSKVDHVHVLST